MSFEEFKEEFAKVLKHKYGIVPNDCTDDTRLKNAFEDEQSPQEYVDYLGEKYELNEIER